MVHLTAMPLSLSPLSLNLITLVLIRSVLRGALLPQFVRMNFTYLPTLDRSGVRNWRFASTRYFVQWTRQQPARNLSKASATNSRLQLPILGSAYGPTEKYCNDFLKSANEA